MFIFSSSSEISGYTIEQLYSLILGYATIYLLHPSQLVVIYIYMYPYLADLKFACEHSAHLANYVYLSNLKHPEKIIY